MLFRSEETDSVPAGSVISCSPGVGNSVEEGTSVNLVVSKKPTQTTPEPDDNVTPEE